MSVISKSVVNDEIIARLNQMAPRMVQAFKSSGTLLRITDLRRCRLFEDEKTANLLGSKEVTEVMEGDSEERTTAVFKAGDYGIDDGGFVRRRRTVDNDDCGW